MIQHANRVILSSHPGTKSGGPTWDRSRSFNGGHYSDCPWRTVTQLECHHRHQYIRPTQFCRPFLNAGAMLTAWIDADEEGPMTDDVKFTWIEDATGMAEFEDDRVKPVSVLKSTGANVVIFAFAAGSSLPKHHSNQPILLQALVGTLLVNVNGADIGLSPGDLLHIEPGVEHNVSAFEPAKLQLTVLMIDSPGPSTLPLSEM